MFLHLFLLVRQLIEGYLRVPRMDNGRHEHVLRKVAGAPVPGDDIGPASPNAPIGSDGIGRRAPFLPRPYLPMKAQVKLRHVRLVGTDPVPGVIVTQYVDLQQPRQVAEEGCDEAEVLGVPVGVQQGVLAARRRRRVADAVVRDVNGGYQIIPRRPVCGGLLVRARVKPQVGHGDVVTFVLGQCPFDGLDALPLPVCEVFSLDV